MRLLALPAELYPHILPNRTTVLFSARDMIPDEKPFVNLKIKVFLFFPKFFLPLSPHGETAEKRHRNAWLRCLFNS